MVLQFPSFATEIHTFSWVGSLEVYPVQYLTFATIMVYWGGSLSNDRNTDLVSKQPAVMANAS